MGERRATGAAVRRLAERLSDRDWAILADVARVRVLTGKQLERLHFAELDGNHRDRTRRQVLERLTGLGLLTTLERRIGGSKAGSAGLAFALGLAGQKLIALEVASGERTRQPGMPTDRFLAHTMAVAGLYVGLREIERAKLLSLHTFLAEPGCWWQSSEGEWIKPDALVVVSAGENEDHWSVEVDQATESLPTLRRKLKVYVELALNGEHGPERGPLPRVLVTVPTEARRSAVAGVIATLVEVAKELISVAVHSGATEEIARIVRE